MDNRLRFALIALGAAAAIYFFFLRKPSAPTTTPTHVLAPPPAAGRPPEEHPTVRSGGLSAEVTSWSGALRNLRLTEAPYKDPKDGKPFQLSTTWREEALPLRADIAFDRNGTNVLPAYLSYHLDEQSPQRVTMTAELPDQKLLVRRTIEAAAEYAFKIRTEIVNQGEPGVLRFSQGIHHWITRSDESGGFFQRSWRVSEALCSHHDTKLIRATREEVNSASNHSATRTQWIGLGNLYVLNALIPEGTEEPTCLLDAEDRGDLNGEPSGTLLSARVVYNNHPLATNERHSYQLTAYFGPKLKSSLEAVSKPLTEAINLGPFAIIARGLLWLLRALYSVVGNWGVAIMLLTFLVRTALFPILARSIKSMAMMQKLKPELDALNAKYADDAERRGLATMELYRKHNVNPVAGCLPQMAQIPIWWALYATLQTSVELFHAPFMLWWSDLSAPDPYKILPLILGVLIFLQQKLMPPSMPDPAQAKIMMYFMPIFLTGISLFLPAGLALYMLVNSVLAMVQQKITKMQIDRLTGAGGVIDVRPVLAAEAASSNRDSNKSRR